VGAGRLPAEALVCCSHSLMLSLLMLTLSQTTPTSRTVRCGALFATVNRLK
jgi:hypothetical protein